MSKLDVCGRLPHPCLSSGALILPSIPPHRGPFVEPVSSNKCSHTFCKHCITRHHETLATMRETSNGEGPSSSSSSGGSDFPLPCPSCRAMSKLSSFSATSPPLIRNMVDSLQVLCPVRERGCSWEGERSSLDHHLRRDCQWVWVGEFDEDVEGEEQTVDGKALPMPSAVKHARRRRARCECGSRILRKDWDRHREEGCASKWARCEWCKEMIKATEEGDAQEVSSGNQSVERAMSFTPSYTTSPIGQAHASSCPSAPLECEHCHETLLRSGLHSHLDEACAGVVVSCPMAAYGCSWTGPRAQQDHGCSLKPLLPFLEATQARLQALEDDNAALRRDAEESRRAWQESQEQLKACVSVLGRFVTVGRGEGVRGEPEAARPRSRADSAVVDDIEWPSTGETIDETPVERLAPLRRSTSTASSARSYASTGPFASSSSSRLESTLDSLSTTTSTLSAQQRDLSHLVHDTRRDSLMAGAEVGRLADEVTSLRIGLHNVARQMQARGGGGIALGPATAAGASSSKGVAGLATQGEQAGKSGSKGGLEATHQGPAGAASSLSAGVAPGIGGPLHHHHYYLQPPPHAGHYYHHHPFDMAAMPTSPFYGPAPPPPGYPHHTPFSTSPGGGHPGLRRYWSGFEQTKL